MRLDRSTEAGTRPGEGRKVALDGHTNWSKFDHATALAAALAYITLRQGDRVGLVVYADEVRAMVKRSSSQGTWRQIVGALSTHALEADNRSRATDLPRVVEQTLGKLNNRCLVALISDFFMDIEQFRDALARLRFHGHDVLVFQVLDRAELEFDMTDAAPFEGMEGEGMVRIDPRAIRKAYVAEITGHISEVEKAARAFGYDYQRLSTHDWLGPPLAHFVAQRNAIIKRGKQR